MSNELPSEIEKLGSLSDDELYAVLGNTYISENLSWIGTPTGPSPDEIGDPKSVGLRIWGNVKPKLRAILCGDSVTAKAIDGMQAPTLTLLVEHLIPVLSVSLVMAPLTVKVLAIIIARSLLAMGRAKLCELLK